MILTISSAPAGGLGADRASRVPGVLAHRDPDPDAADDVEVLGAVTRQEVTLLVEHRVIGQVDFVVNASDLAAGTNGGRVIKIEPFVDKSDDGCTSLCSLGHLGKSNLVVGDEPRLQQQVLRWVTGDGQLGEHGQVRTAVSSARPKAVDHPFDIAGEVANHRVELAEGNAQPGHRLTSVGRCRPRPRRLASELAASADPVRPSWGLAACRRPPEAVERLRAGGRCCGPRRDRHGGQPFPHPHLRRPTRWRLDVLSALDTPGRPLEPLSRWKDLEVLRIAALDLSGQSPLEDCWRLAGRPGRRAARRSHSGRAATQGRPWP